MQNEYSLKENMALHGFGHIDQLIPDGRIHRFEIEGAKPGSLDGWYAYHLDGIEAAVFGDWSTGSHHTWCSKPAHDLTGQAACDHHNETQRIIKESRYNRDIERADMAAGARDTAAYILSESKPVDESHPYLKSKRIKAFGLTSYKESLIAPAEGIDSNLNTIQFIDADGSKRFLKGGAKKGSFYRIGTPKKVILICEGVATGHSLYEWKGEAVVVAFDSGNLKPVAVALREKYPDMRLIICADNDWNKDTNTGLIKANEAAKAVSGEVSYPVFDCSNPDHHRLTDWNDYYIHYHLGGAS